ncbi:MAG: ferrous iron transporter B, partial [Desulfovibrionaceae bacterium]|nr:ferrous iron transporter B [Desulfovibrionaceae bacterium]
ERTWMYLKKAGTILVAVSILIWASMNYPQMDEKQAAMYEEAVTAAEAKLEGVDEKAPEYEALKSAVEDAKNEQSSAELKNSFAGRLGRAIEPVTLPAGFDWRTDIALLGGIAAKEAILSTLGTAYSLGEVDPEDAPSLSERLSKDPGWSKSVALSLMLFVLLYSPCFVALVVIKEEAGSWKWLAFSVIFNTLLAYGVAVVAMRFGKVLFG